jgi:hypothetical protein
MDTSIIIVLAIILLALIILNNIKIDNSIATTSNITTTTTTTTRKANCSQTIFGCCPNGVDSKIDHLGTNCPGYNPGPGYLPTPNPVLPPNPIPGPSPPPKKPIGGCAGTRYGCCPDNIKPKIDVNGSNCLVN